MWIETKQAVVFLRGMDELSGRDVERPAACVAQPLRFRQIRLAPPQLSFGALGSGNNPLAFALGRPWPVAMLNLDTHFFPVFDRLDPSTAYPHTYNLGLVATSVAIAILAAFVALSISARIECPTATRPSGRRPAPTSAMPDSRTIGRAAYPSPRSVEIMIQSLRRSGSAPARSAAPRTSRPKHRGVMHAGDRATHDRSRDDVCRQSG